MAEIEKEPVDIDAEEEEDENEQEEEEEHAEPSKLANLFGNDEEEDSSSDYDMQQYRSMTELDSYAFHRAAEDGDVTRLREFIERFGDRPERKDTWGLTPLHTAIIASNFECFLVLLDWKGTSLDSLCQGSPIPHVILSVAHISSNAEFGLKALTTLLDRGHSKLLTESKDEYERTPLRLACELGLEVEFIQILLNAFESVADLEYRREVLANCDKIKRWNALHAAADIYDAKRREQVIHELLNHGGFADVVNYFDAFSRTSLHVLVRRTGVFSEQDPCCALLLGAGVNKSFKDVTGREAAHYARQAARKRRGPTAIFSHEICSKHYTAPPEDTRQPWYSKKDVPPENVNRLLVLLNEKFGTLKSRRILASAKHDTNPPLCEMGDIIRVHDWGYIMGVKAKCDRLDTEDELGELDGDTTYSKRTWDASLRACGSALEAVDRVLTGKCENAFCAVRPPGHHAGPSGLCPECTSHGFCFLNNVAIAAGYALDRHRDRIKRVAIVDFDVHHGNGTEVCVENLVPNQVKGKFELPLGGEMVISRPTYKPWLGDNDSQNVLFCSVHGFGKAIPGMDPDPQKPPQMPSFYPGSGKDRGWNEPSSILNVGQNSGSRYEWRQAWRKIVLPRVIRFKPDLIIVSAGFDAHAKDSINGGYCGALEQDYEWLTQQIVAVANETCEGRVVSILEGGYRIQGMCVSAFARSVAEHVRVLTESDPNIKVDPDEVKFEIEDLEKKVNLYREMEVERRQQQHLLAMLMRQGGAPTTGTAEDEEDEDEEEDEEEEEEEEGGAGEGEGDASLQSVDGDAPEEIMHENEEAEEVLRVQATTTTTTAHEADRPRRRTAANIDYVKLNEDLNKEKEAKRQKTSE